MSKKLQLKINGTTVEIPSYVVETTVTPDLEGYATEDYVKSYIENNASGTIDLSTYTKTDTFNVHTATNGSSTVKGHVNVNDNYLTKVENGDAAHGVAASQNALFNVYTAIESKINNSSVSTALNNASYANLEDFVTATATGSQSKSFKFLDTTGWCPLATINGWYRCFVMYQNAYTSTDHSIDGTCFLFSAGRNFIGYITGTLASELKVTWKEIGSTTDITALDTKLTAVINGKVSTTDFNSFKSDNTTVINAKLDTSSFESYMEAFNSDLTVYQGQINDALNSKANKTDLEGLTVKYTNETYNYDNAEVSTVLTDILNTVNYVTPAISSFSVTPSTTTYEIGTTVNSLTFNWKNNKTMKTQSLTGCTITATDTTATYSTALSASKGFTLSVSDGKNSASKTININFYNKKYYGVADAQSTYTSTFLLGLTGVLTSGRTGNFTVNAGAGKYIYFAVPTSFGTCNFAVGGFSGGFDLVDTLSFTNASGYTSSYNIYRSKNANLGSTTVTVS